MKKQTKIIRSISELQGFARNILSTLRSKQEATVILLSGELGSGKTAFTKELGKLLKVKEEILSPTFVIMKLYDISHRNFKKLIHIDAYRIENINELEVLRWREIITDPRNLIVLEWPERVAALIPKNAQTIHFEFVDEYTRSAKI